jgi:hypothetical protein
LLFRFLGLFELVLQNGSDQLNDEHVNDNHHGNKIQLHPTLEGVLSLAIA